MKRLAILALFVAFGCSRPHGDAPESQYPPGGPIDARSNAATERSLGSAEPPAEPEIEELEVPYASAERENQPSDRYDAGGGPMLPSTGTLERVEGQVARTGENAVEVHPDDGSAPVRVELRDQSTITWEGSVVSAEAIQPGARIRASIDEEGVARRVVVQAPPAMP